MGPGLRHHQKVRVEPRETIHHGPQREYKYLNIPQPAPARQVWSWSLLLRGITLCRGDSQISIVLHVNVNHSFAFTNISKEWQHQRRHGNDNETQPMNKMNISVRSFTSPNSNIICYKSMETTRSSQVNFVFCAFIAVPWFMNSPNISPQQYCLLMLIVLYIFSIGCIIPICY